jgi:hypothetical protein
LRYRALTVTRPEEAKLLLINAQAALDDKYRAYERFSRMKDGPAPSEVTVAGSDM